jgi:hypothetical protein
LRAVIDLIEIDFISSVVKRVIFVLLVGQEVCLRKRVGVSEFPLVRPESRRCSSYGPPETQLGAPDGLQQSVFVGSPFNVTREVTGEFPNKMEDFSKRVRGRWLGQLSDAVFCLAKKFLELFVNLRKSSDKFR